MRQNRDRALLIVMLMNIVITITTTAAARRHGVDRPTSTKLPSEVAEEEDLELYGFSCESVSDGDVQELAKISLWISAMGCLLLVSMASLVCLIILLVIFCRCNVGRCFSSPTTTCFCGGHSHSHEHHVHDAHGYHTLGHESPHAHSFEDLSVGLSVMSGIVLFLLVEKIVRYVEDHSTIGHEWDHGQHHHHHKSNNKLKKVATDKSDSKSHVDGKRPDPQKGMKKFTKVGDFGILVRSGFSVPKALFFNLLSALVALVGTALALIFGKDPGQSSLIDVKNPRLIMFQFMSITSKHL